MSEGKIVKDVGQAMEVVSEYLAAFLAVEQDWSVIDGLMHARRKEEALEAYDRALRSVHRVLQERGGLLHYHLADNALLRDLIGGHVKHSEKGTPYVEQPFFSRLFDEASRLVKEELGSRTRERSLELAERALAKYPKYAELKG